MVFVLHCLVNADINSEDGWILELFREIIELFCCRFYLSLLQQIAITMTKKKKNTA
jgi:hypothetical protein